ncbi:hypothetical protein MRX96_000971 [Rhipicephalus microplus]
MYCETYPADKCKVCRRETADHTYILWDCIKHSDETRSRTIPTRLEAAVKSYDQDLRRVKQHRRRRRPPSGRVSAQLQAQTELTQFNVRAVLVKHSQVYGIVTCELLTYPPPPCTCGAQATLLCTSVRLRSFTTERLLHYVV